MKLPSMEDRIKGGLYGVAAGDALGATVDFMNREEIQRQYGTLRDIVGWGWLRLLWAQQSRISSLIRRPAPFVPKLIGRGCSSSIKRFSASARLSARIGR
ncbi:ADP-ribosylglycohydrolase family protein [Kyrpidia tusciae]|uniref:ADP-ribosylation/Crystallin J1 n=1 Tax=Kyrpidia tusciae (strain DSM 2912 / NBRC 15312 / T2) TaxID=562970 RepID=D5WRT1_KYRT2|nr:ADP-ribosylglycohydrolase family protein [Kyrpidia tusciae]ADG06883.1 ADP-ribosylation/Crystallin J1 [Kyrpidia tusciae DSM 2912]